MAREVRKFRVGLEGTGVQYKIAKQAVQTAVKVHIDVSETGKEEMTCIGELTEQQYSHVCVWLSHITESRTSQTPEEGTNMTWQTIVLYVIAAAFIGYIGFRIGQAHPKPAKMPPVRPMPPPSPSWESVGQSPCTR